MRQIGEGASREHDAGDQRAQTDDSRRAQRRDAIFESAVDFAIVAPDRDGLITDWNSGAEKVLGWTADEMIGQTANRFFTPEDRDIDRIGTEMTFALRDGSASDERWHLRKDGSRFWASGEMLPLRDDDGTQLGFVKILRDRTEQRLAGERIAASEARYRTLFDSIDEGFCVIEFRDGPHGPLSDYVHVEANPAYERHTGIANVVGQSIRTMSPDEADGWVEAFAKVLRTGEPVRFEREFVLARRHIEVTAHRIEPPTRRQVAVLLNDISARVRAAEHQSILNRELSHRMKNTLAMVQAIANQTLRNAADLTSARDALSARLVAMSKAHDILLTGAREGASLEELVREALAIHEDAQVQRLRLSGPLVRVGPRAALSLALLVHELATNATKYGALSTADGVVSVAWTIEDGQPNAALHLRWTEAGGPPVAAPTRRGFGSVLIERGLTGAIGGEVRISYPVTGVVCDLTAPLAKIEAEE